MTGDSVGDRPALRVVIAGAGRFGALHARTWQEAGASVVGVADIDLVRARELAAPLGDVEAGADASEMITDTAPDAVIVATDEASHTDLAERALRAGCHVFVEKPFAMDAASAHRLEELAGKVRGEVIAGHISRFAQPYVDMRKALRDGRIGELWSLRLRRDFSRSWFESFGDRVDPVWESCIHDIDLALSFAGGRARRVMAMRSAAAGASASSVVSGLIELDNGVLVTVETAWTIPEQAPQTESGALELPGSIVGEAEAHGSAGVIRQRLLNDSLAVWSDRASWAPNPFLWPLVDGVVGGALRHEIDYAIEVFSGRRANALMPPEEAVHGIEIAEALVESLDTGAPTVIETAASTGEVA